MYTPDEGTGSGMPNVLISPLTVVYVGYQEYLWGFSVPKAVTLLTMGSRSHWSSGGTFRFDVGSKGSRTPDIEPPFPKNSP